MESQCERSGGGLALGNGLVILQCENTTPRAMPLETGVFDGRLQVSVSLTIVQVYYQRNSPRNQSYKTLLAQCANVTLEDCRNFPEEAELCTSNYETLEAFVRTD